MLDINRLAAVCKDRLRFRDHRYVLIAALAKIEDGYFFEQQFKAIFFASASA